MINDKGKNNVISMDASDKLNSCTINFYGNNNLIEIGKGCKIENIIFTFYGDNHRVILKDRVTLYEGAIVFEDSNNLLEIGEGTLCFQHLSIAVVEPARKVIIGIKCLFSNTITIRTSDSHSIIDNGTGQRINLGKDIIIGDRVWVCEKVHILKGANIGSDSVIGTCSVVTKGNYLNNSLLAGNPAKIRKSNISWLAERIYG